MNMPKSTRLVSSMGAVAALLGLLMGASKADNLVNVDPAQLVSGSVIDQAQYSYSHTSGFRDVELMLAQTFTVGVTGELGTIGILLHGGIITLNLLQTSAGVPTSTILSSAVAIPNPPNTNNLTYFNFSSSHIPVSAGQVLAFEPSTTASGGQVLGIEIAYGSHDPYTRGELYTIVPEEGITEWQPFASRLIDQGPVGGVDAAFVISVTPAASVPGPIVGTGLPGILFAGGGLLAWWRRKRKVAAIAVA
jgi:hypothetical protein